MKRIKLGFLGVAVLGLIVGCRQSSNSEKEIGREKANRPNVIFIYPDQYRNYSLGIWSKPGYSQYIQGNPDPVITPALDKLASEGVVFNRAVSNFPLCSPYRGMMLSGMYPANNGVTINCRSDRDITLRRDIDCVTDVFAKRGYDVSYFGKCHWIKTEPLFDENGAYQGTTAPPGGYYVNRYDTYVPAGPDRHSIDYFVQTLTDSHFNPVIYSSDPKVVEGKKDGEPFKINQFSAEFEAEKIIDYLKNTHGQRDENKPFMLMWSLNPPHNPWDEANTHMEYFGQYTEQGEINYDKLLTHENVDQQAGDYAPYYFANVSAVDNYIGTVMETLDKLGLSENTIVVFTSDHGEMLGSHGLQGKNYPEIEALNIPFIVRWGKKLQHRVEDLILSVPDVMPTLLAMAGMEEDIPNTVEGKDYSELILDVDNTKVNKPEAVLIMTWNSRGVYTGDYTFVVLQKEDESLDVFCYNNKKDPAQLIKIAYAEMDNDLRSSLKSKLEQFLVDTNDEWYQKKVASEFLSYDL